MLDQSHHIQREVNNYYLVVATLGGRKKKKVFAKCFEDNDSPNLRSDSGAEHPLDSSLMPGD